MSGKLSGVDAGVAGSVGTGSTVQRRGTAGGASGLAGTGDTTDSVQITDAASQLSALEQAALVMPGVDEARVSAIRNAIEQGSYTVSPGHVADQLTRMEQLLGGLGEKPA